MNKKIKTNTTIAAEMPRIIFIPVILPADTYLKQNQIRLFVHCRGRRSADFPRRDFVGPRPPRPFPGNDRLCPLHGSAPARRRNRIGVRRKIFYPDAEMPAHSDLPFPFRAFRFSQISGKRAPVCPCRLCRFKGHMKKDLQTALRWIFIPSFL